MPHIMQPRRFSRRDSVVLVTGGCGFVGRNLVRSLLEDCAEIWIIDDLSTGVHPDRWLPERSKHFHKHQYFPFASGPRMCIGAGFAMMEGQLVLATIARRHRIDLVPGHKVEPEPLITLRPRRGVRATVHRIG